VAKGHLMSGIDEETMKRKPYCCESSRQMYEDYYTGQVGGEIPVFRGAKRQRGHGLEVLSVACLDALYFLC